MDLAGHRHSGRCRDASSLVCFTELGRLEELARPCLVLVFSKEDEIVGFVGATEDPRAGPRGELSPQLTAFFTSAAILASSAALNSFSANAVGHMAPSSRFASSLKPNVAYLVLNFCALWKKQTTLPSLAYAGIPYQVFGERPGALALMIAWSRLAMARSGSDISAIFASTALSPSTWSPRGPLRACAFSSWARSFIAARSSS